MITFDDGYVDNYELAFPVLKANDAKGVFFVATGFIDEPRLAWWDEIAWMIRSSTPDPLASAIPFRNCSERSGGWPVDDLGNDP